MGGHIPAHVVVGRGRGGRQNTSTSSLPPWQPKQPATPRLSWRPSWLAVMSGGSRVVGGTGVGHLLGAPGQRRSPNTPVSTAAQIIFDFFMVRMGTPPKSSR